MWINFTPAYQIQKALFSIMALYIIQALEV